MVSLSDAKCLQHQDQDLQALALCSGHWLAYQLGACSALQVAHGSLQVADDALQTAHSAHGALQVAPIAIQVVHDALQVVHDAL